MNNCWLCQVKLTKENCAGGVDYSRTCKTCNTVYSMILSLKKLPKEEIEAKMLEIKNRLAIHQTVVDNFDEKPAAIARRFYKEV